MSGLIGLPIGVLLVMVSQIGGFLITRELELAVWQRVWLMNAAVAAVLAPVLAIQTEASRVPYVSREWGGWSLVWWATIGAALVVFALGLLAAGLSADDPEESSLLFVPTAVIVPAMLGAPSDITERAALGVLTEAFAVSTIACVAGWLIPSGLRPLVAPVTLGVQFILLWVLGYGPHFSEERGELVPVMGGVILVVTTILTVMTPLISSWFRRVMRVAAGPSI
jgi:hypothetical protein